MLIVENQVKQDHLPFANFKHQIAAQMEIAP